VSWRGFKSLTGDGECEDDEDDVEDEEEVAGEARFSAL
jgi:hypothetical protein